VAGATRVVISAADDAEEVMLRAAAARACEVCTQGSSEHALRGKLYKRKHMLFMFPRNMVQQQSARLFTKETFWHLQATAMNAASSRSHSVLTLHIRGRHDGSGERLTGALNLVDLAGRCAGEGIRGWSAP
jgi:Kinesin motor domain